MTYTLRILLLSLGCAVPVLGAVLEAGWAQETGNAADTFDCVIEPRRVVELGSPEDGVVSEMLVDRGDFVQAGDAVARLDFELQALTVELARIRADRDVEVRASRARLDFRKREVARARQLHEKNVLSTKLLDEANIERQLAQYDLAAAEMEQRAAEVELRIAEARLERRMIRSTATGVVTEVTKSAGELTHDQAPVMTIAEINPLHVEVFVPIEEYGRIGVGMEADVMPNAPVSGSYTARVDVVDRVLDAASGTFGVRLELANPDYRLPAGLKCRVRFPIRKAEASQPPELPVDANDATPSTVDDGSMAEETASGPIVDEPGSAAPSPAWSGKALIYLVQTKLLDAGYDVGPADGVLGEKTRAAIRAYQEKNGLPVDGAPSLDLFNALRKGEKEPD